MSDREVDCLLHERHIIRYHVFKCSAQWQMEVFDMRDTSSMVRHACTRDVVEWSM